MLNTTNWVKYPFTVNGVDFVSMLDPKGSFYPQVEKLPEGALTNWHSSMINNLIGDVANMSKEKLQARIDEVNDGATQAILALA
mgnify:FL=1